MLGDKLINPIGVCIHNMRIPSKGWDDLIFNRRSGSKDPKRHTRFEVVHVKLVHCQGPWSPWTRLTLYNMQQQEEENWDVSKISKSAYVFFHFTQLSNWILNMILRPQTSLETHTRTHPHPHPHTCCFNGSTPTSHVV